MQIAAGEVRRAEILVKVPQATIDHATEIIDALTELSIQRKAAELPYLTWTATGLLFGYLENDEARCQEMLQLTTQTHPAFHVGMERSEFESMVGLYAEHLAAVTKVDLMYVNFLPPHVLAVYQVNSEVVGRTSA